MRNYVKYVPGATRPEAIAILASFVGTWPIIPDMQAGTRLPFRPMSCDHGDAISYN